MTTIRVLLVGGTTLFRAGIHALIEHANGIEIVGEGNTLAEGLRQVSGSPPDIVLLDVVSAPDLVLQAIEQARPGDAPGRLLVVATRNDLEAIRRIVIAGARGVVFKDASADHLLTAIRRVHEGELWVDRVTMGQILSGMVNERRKQEAQPERAKIVSLTRRERDVIPLVAGGLCNKAIARRLSISDNTVRHHLTSIFGKLGVPDRLALVLYAFRHELASEETPVFSGRKDPRLAPQSTGLAD
jgi:DNA-binding NarL/FixJ family response regulator